MPKVNKLNFKLLLILFVLVFCVFVPSGKAQGLRFSCNNSLISKRTSYRVFTDNAYSFKSKLHIDFDLMLWDQNHLGYIVLVTDKENSYSLSYLNTKNISSLNFNIDRVSNKLSIPLKNDEIKKRKWIKVQLTFDLINNTVTLCIDKKCYKATGFQFSKELLGNIIFGKNQYYTEVPDMAVKNLEIYDASSHYSFPLNEWKGNAVHANNGDVVGTVENPIWLINNSYFWNPVYQKAFTEVAGINFDAAAQQLLMYKSDSLLIYNTQNNTSAIYPYKNALPVPMILGKSIYNSAEKRCYVYDAYDIVPGKASIAALDIQTLRWQTIGHALLPTQRHHHNVFYNNSQDTVFLFGGYGAFKYHNSFFKYDRSADKWVATSFKGDKINPRFFSASVQVENLDEVLVFGGYGNESGDQIIGGKEFYDLYRINLKTHTIKKCWNIKAGKEPFVPANNLILSADKKYFYALCYPHEKFKTHLMLYKFSVKDGSYDIVSAPIPVTSEKIETDINLFYDAKAKEFYCAVQEFTDPTHSHIKIYALANPPVSAALYNQSVHPVKKNTYIWLYALLGASGLLIAAGVWYGFKPKVKIAEKENTPEDAPVADACELHEADREPNEVKTNAVYLLGEFTVYDKSGRDFTYLFSPKIKQLFLLILLSNSKGITSKKISLTLWPDKEVAKTKNLRGVTFNHLRGILSDLEGIQLQFANDVYLFVIDDSFFCDYFIIQKHLKNLDKVSFYNEDYYQLLMRGGLLADMGDAWLDDYKQSYDEQLMQALIPQLDKLYQEKQMKQVLELARLILQISPFNDDAIKYELKAVKKLKGKDQAKRIFEQFADDYNKSFGEPYPLNFEEISQ